MRRIEGRSDRSSRGRRTLRQLFWRRGTLVKALAGRQTPKKGIFEGMKLESRRKGKSLLAVGPGGPVAPDRPLGEKSKPFLKLENCNFYTCLAPERPLLSR